MFEVKTPLKECPDYGDDGDSAFIIEPKHTIKDVLRFCYEDDPENFMYLAEQVFIEESE